MRRRRFLIAFLILIGLAGLIYVALSLFVPSSRRLIVGINKHSGRVRTVDQNLAFLPPSQFYRLSFERRNGYAQRDGVIKIRSKEGIPVKVTYRIRFSIVGDRLADPKRLVQEGWSSWLGARVAEAVQVVTTQVGVEDLASPMSQFSRERQALVKTVAAHLAGSGLNVNAFVIQRIEVDRQALLEHKRLELRRNARGAVGRVALFALDGADWELLSELIIDQRMPNLQALIKGGVTGNVQTIQPTVSPMLWVTAATGLPPDRHGVVDFFDPKAPGKPVDSVARRAPAVWDIAAAFGRPAEVVGWWTAWPPADDAMVFDTPVQLIESAVSPSRVSAIVRQNVVPDSTVQYPQIRRFLNITPAEFDNSVNKASSSDPTFLFRSVLAKTWSDHRVAINLYRESNPALLMVSYEGTDFVNHLFGPYHPPYRDGVSSEGFRRYWPTVANYYSEIDRLLGEWMRILPQDTTVLIVSAHGMKWGKDRPKEPPRGTSALPMHRPLGVLIAFGNRVAGGHRTSCSLYDLTPTVLGLLGLPRSKEMPGQLLTAAFSGVSPVEGVTVTSYGDFVSAHPVVAGDSVNPAVYKVRLQQIGHLIDPRRLETPPQPTSNHVPVGSKAWGLYAYYNDLGVQLRAKNQLREATDAFAQAVDLNPDRPVAYINLAQVLFDRQQYTPAENVFLKAVQLGLPNAEKYFVDFAALYRARDMPTRAVNLLLKGQEIFPGSFAIAANLGSALAAMDRYTDAQAQLERALAVQPSSTLVLNNLALLHLKKKDYARALDYWNRSLAIDPRQPKIREALSAVQSQL